jgi:hypothetical protein
MCVCVCVCVCHSDSPSPPSPHQATHTSEESKGSFGGSKEGKEKTSVPLHQYTELNRGVVPIMQEYLTVLEKLEALRRGPSIEGTATPTLDALLGEESITWPGHIHGDEIANAGCGPCLLPPSLEHQIVVGLSGAAAGGAAGVSYGRSLDSILLEADETSLDMMAKALGLEHLRPAMTQPGLCLSLTLHLFILKSEKLSAVPLSTKGPTTLLFNIVTMLPVSNTRPEDLLSHAHSKAL